MEEKICEYAKDVSNYFNKALWCNIINNYCGKCRWCKTKNKLVMTSEYIKNGCNIKHKYENNQKGGI